MLISQSTHSQFDALFPRSVTNDEMQPTSTAGRKHFCITTATSTTSSYAGIVYNTAQAAEDTPKRKIVASLHSTWLPTLHGVISGVASSGASKRWSSISHGVISGQSPEAKEWQGAIQTALIDNKIEWVPGDQAGRLVARNIFFLEEPLETPSYTPIRGHQTMEDRAMDASAQIRQQAQPQLTAREFLKFGVSIPFHSLPEFVEQAFVSQIERANPSQDTRTTSHYIKVRSILKTRLQHPLYQLMVILGTALASTNVYLDADLQPVTRWRPVLDPTKNREPQSRVVAFITYAIWFLCPDDFPLANWTTLGQTVWGRSSMKEKIGIVP